MDIFFLSLKKLLVATVFIVFAFVMTYVPQLPTSHVEPVQAAATGSVINDPINTAQNALSTVQETITAAVGTVDWTKNLSLDGIAWSLAKRAISGMVTSLIDWVNSGFEGRPAFITDLDGFLLNIADEEFGRVISELGSVGSFVCSPFRLDVQISIALQYAQSRNNNGNSAPTCTLSGVIDNIQGFIDGTDPGRGLADWLTITSQPQTYTPYGAVLASEEVVRARLVNAQGEELKILEFGDGFLSQTVCESISGFTGSQDCSIVTPGKAIQEALTLNLDSGRQVLVQADEINELVGALLGQLANEAITGAAGLLGLSGGTGQSYGGYDGSFLDALTQEGDDVVADSTGTVADTLATALRSERAYRASSQQLLDQLAEFIADTTNTTGERNIAAIINEEIFSEILRSNTAITNLTALITEYDTADQNRRVEIFLEYSALDITDDVRKEQNIADWSSQMSLLGIDPRDTRGIDQILDNLNTGTTSTTTP